MSLVAILDNQKVLNPFEHVFNQQTQKIIQFGCSNAGYAALFENRRTIAIAGDLLPEQLNVEESWRRARVDEADAKQLTVKLISLPEAESSSIDQICVARSAILCLTFSGRVYGYGKAAHACTKREQALNEGEMSPFLSQVEAEVKATDNKLFPIHEVFDTKCYFVFGGNNNCFLWTTNHLSTTNNYNDEEEHNIVYSYGINNDRALGKVSMKFGESESFRIVKGRVVKMANGFGHTLVLSNTGQVYGCGYSHFGELGLGQNIGLPQLTRLDFFKDMSVSDVDCGTFHSVFLVTKPQVALYTCGKSQDGQIGHDNHSSMSVLKPIQIEFPPGHIPIKVAARGRWSLVITTNGSSESIVFAVGQVYKFPPPGARTFAPIFNVHSGLEVKSVIGGEMHIAMLLTTMNSPLQKRLITITKFQDVQVVLKR